MTESQWLMLAGQFGGSGLALVVLGYLFGKVVIPMVKSAAEDFTTAIKDLASAVKEHSAMDARVVERLQALELKLDDELAWLRSRENTDRIRPVSHGDFPEGSQEPSRPGKPPRRR